ncbi:MAG: hypothetical protein LAT67_08680 [Balneolales bacterium]|nr:hypothetical protein [Balneolales bacterium]
MRHLTLLLLVFLIPTSPNAQDRDTGNEIIIEYDAKSQRFVNLPSSVRYGSYVSIRISNINKERLEIDAAISQVNRDSERAKAFEVIELIDTDIKNTLQERGIPKAVNDAFQEYRQEINQRIEEILNISDCISKVSQDYMKVYYSTSDWLKLEQFLIQNEADCKYDRNTNQFNKAEIQNVVDNLTVNIDSLSSIVDTMDAALEVRIESFTSLRVQLKNLELSELLKEVDNANTQLHYLDDRSNYIYQSQRIRAEEDYVSLSFNINTVGEEPTKFYQQDDLLIPVSGGWRLGFSTGVLLSTLYDKKYERRTISDATVVRKQEELASLPITPHLSALMTLSRRTQGNAQFGFSSGLGFNAEDFNDTEFYFGLSVSVGRANQFVFSSGLVVGQVERLRPRFNTNPTVPSDFSGDDFTNEVYRTGFFIGVTYSLTSLKRVERTISN